MNSSSNGAIATATPAWWTRDVWETVKKAAEVALPNEVCGLIYTEVYGVAVHCFEAEATATSCFAVEQEVIDFAFSLRDANASVLATFHSHPLGWPQLSARDAGLADWAQLHLLLVPHKELWEPHWFTIQRAQQTL
ncbi:Mov34/MPN/PAD-1 family protein [Alicyclobacillus sp. ALC3]|uniref:Mov34/MPN/PAD-1 family protein n=1 Tax=Alicyclobacillus sp. ALC3 TaxID=2796143 RepID=UPI002379CFEF|nr:Mov34/MPN/PAD-1 family protein [Alicyclobacillus sp. ALC3]WDL97002.1 Mov34/MPN/PAD-1 family protein [Alicyclobacillus sp. ALC3]